MKPVVVWENGTHSFSEKKNPDLNRVEKKACIMHDSISVMSYWFRGVITLSQIFDQSRWTTVSIVAAKKNAATV